MGGVVQRNAVEGNPHDVMSLQCGEELKGIVWVLVSRELDVAQVLVDLITGICRHAGCQFGLAFQSHCLTNWP